MGPQGNITSLGRILSIQQGQSSLTICEWIDMSSVGLRHKLATYNIGRLCSLGKAYGLFPNFTIFHVEPMSISWLQPRHMHLHLLLLPPQPLLHYDRKLGINFIQWGAQGNVVGYG